MKIDYENYKVYSFTKSYLERHFMPQIIERYGKQLAFLVQNGYMIESNDIDAIEGTMILFNGIASYDDLDDIIASCNNIDPSTFFGDKIIENEFYNFIESTKWAVEELSNGKLMKKSCEVYSDIINKEIEIVSSLYSSRDIAIKLSLESFKKTNKDIYNSVAEKTANVRKFIDKKILSMVYISFSELREEIFKMYLVYSKHLSAKKDDVGLVKGSNLNDEIYGSSGGYNPATKEIKTRNGSAVYELKLITGMDYAHSECIARLKTIVKEIMYDADVLPHFDKASFVNEKDRESFTSLKNFLDNQVGFKESILKIVQNIEINGITALLSLKYGIPFNVAQVNKKTGKKVAVMYSELKDILNFCGITEYNELLITGK